MLRLTSAQVVAAAASDRLVNVISAPGSGKTTIATERYGYLRYQKGDLRGVLGITFTRAAVAELRRRIDMRWGSNCVVPPHRVVTFDQLHVELLEHLLREGEVLWPNGVTTLDVRDDYRGLKGFRYLSEKSCVCYATLDDKGRVTSERRKVQHEGEKGISRIDDHCVVLGVGVVTHSDVRSILRKVMKQKKLRLTLTTYLSETYRAIIIDEVYDGDALDLYTAYLAAEAGLLVTLIGDPWQAIYKWRGAKPAVVDKLLNGTTDRFVAYEQPESFRFQGDQMPKLARDLRGGVGITLPSVLSSEVDVALARRWANLWSVGDNILPLAFRTVHNGTDAALNLLLDTVTRARLGIESYGREGAILKLGLDRENFQVEQDEIFAPIIASLCDGEDEMQVLQDLRGAIKSLGIRKPSRLRNEENENAAVQNLARLAKRLKQPSVIPGLTVFQAKGREWDRVGVVLSPQQREMLALGLRELEEEHCIIYVAVTRARHFCGQLVTVSELEEKELLLEV